MEKVKHGITIVIWGFFIRGAWEGLSEEVALGLRPEGQEEVSLAVEGHQRPS